MKISNSISEQLTLSFSSLVIGAALVSCAAASDGQGGEGGSSGMSAAAGKGAAAAGGTRATAGATSAGGGELGGEMSYGGASGAGGVGTGGTSSAGGTAAGGAAAGGTAAGGRAGGEAAGGAAPGTAGSSSASAPVLPPIMGECPTFKSGTATIGGLGGITLEVGPKAAAGGGSLIFYWHGTGSSAGEYKSMVPAAVTQEVVKAGGIIVSFQSSLKTGGDCSGTSTFSKGDFAVADLIAACAVRDHGIDPRRIYTTGCSAGGLQAGCMAQLRSSYIAAAVPNSGGVVFAQTFQSPHAPAVMTMHGGASDMVVVSFSQTSATFDKSIKDAGGFVVNCNHGGGHCGAPAALYTAGWQFMKDHPFGFSPEPYLTSLPSSFPSYCAKY